MAVTTNGYNNSDISKWIRETFKKDNFSKIDIEIIGSSEKGDGYVGDISFVDATALTFDAEIKKFHLVIKYGKQNETLRKNMPVRLAFEREIFVYGTVVPIFKQFEEKRNIKLLESFMPKCFDTLLYEQQEVLVFQNLKAIGYDLHDRFQPLDINHLKITFENYGKWHGLSIAYRDQKPKEFHKLFGNLEDIFEKFDTIFETTLKQAEPGLYDILEKNNEFVLAEKLREQFRQGFYEKFQDHLKVKEVNSVFIHGDCWNNNLMFKYNGADRTQPVAAKFLDFQISNLTSPVFDLSYHLYSTASEKELNEFKKLLNVYYSSLSTTIKNLGSDPGLFPYKELIRQWKEYSSYGLIMTTIVLPIALSSKEDVLDIQDLDGEHMAELMESVKQKNNFQLSSRYIAAVKHFLEFNDF